jgi:hypothetical protein
MRVLEELIATVTQQLHMLITSQLAANQPPNAAPASANRLAEPSQDRGDE